MSASTMTKEQLQRAIDDANVMLRRITSASHVLLDQSVRKQTEEYETRIAQAYRMMSLYETQYQRLCGSPKPHLEAQSRNLFEEAEDTYYDLVEEFKGFRDMRHIEATEEAGRIERLKAQIAAYQAQLNWLCAGYQ